MGTEADAQEIALGPNRDKHRSKLAGCPLEPLVERQTFHPGFLGSATGRT